MLMMIPFCPAIMLPGKKGYHFYHQYKVIIRRFPGLRSWFMCVAGPVRRADSGHLASKPSKVTASSGGGEAAVAREEAAAARREAAAAKEAAAAELALMRRELSSAQSAAADAEASLAEAQKVRCLLSVVLIYKS